MSCTLDDNLVKSTIFILCFLLLPHVLHTYLAVDDDGGVDIGAQEGLADGVEVRLQGGRGVAHGDAVVGEPGVLGLKVLHNLR